MATADDSVRARVERLREEIRRHDRLYHVLDRPEIADSAYDALFRELVALETAHPGLATEDSPTRRVGGAVASGLRPVRHPTPMVSIENVTSEQEFRDWEEGLFTWLRRDATSPLRYSVEPKIDGVSLELVYEHGALTVASTRGDGEVGEDVTHNAVTVRSIPKLLAGASPPPYVCVRGEAYVRKPDFLAWNRKQAEAGGETKANPRNFCAGSLRQLDPAMAAARPIRYFAYSIAKAEGVSFAAHSEVLAALRGWGFVVSEENAVEEGADAVAKRFVSLEARRDALPFEIDGMVVKVDDLATQQRLGMRSRSPRWAIAWKFAPRRARTRLLRLDWSVGRTGAVTPLAILDPVSVGGVTITNVGLFNPDQLARLGIKVGDEVIVERAGDVIPYLVGPVVERRTGAETDPVLPTACPSCGAPIARVEGEVRLVCRNFDCPEQVAGRIEHFLSRGGLDVAGIGERQVRQMLAAGLIRDAADLFTLSKDQVVALERQGETSAHNLVTRLAAAKQPPLDRFLYALGIPEVGESGAKTLARAFRTLDALRAATVEELDALDEVGPAMATTVFEWFRDPRQAGFLDRLAAAGVVPLASEGEATGPLSGQTVVFTGTLPTLSREEAKHAAERAGAKLGSSISSKTTLVVAGDAAGSKLKKAKELGVEVIEEAEFLRRIGRASSGTGGS